MKKKHGEHRNWFVKLIGLFLIVLIFVSIFAFTVINDKERLLFKRFFGNKSEVQCVLELWNIDTFESGTNPKMDYIESASIEFEKQNKGAYVLCLNMTVDELMNNLEKGKCPDMFSFSSFVAKKLQNYLTELEENIEIRQILLDSAKTPSEELLALPWCLGGYAVVSSKNRIEQTKHDTEDFSVQNIYALGYEKIKKRSSEQIYSVVYGGKSSLLPNEAINEELKILGISSVSKNYLSVYPSAESLSQYEAYSLWARGKATSLVASQRDLVRLKNRVNAGRETDVFINYLSYYSDLIQYVGVTKNKSTERQKLCENFAKFLVSEKSQKSLGEIGMFSVLQKDMMIYDDEYFSKMERALSHLSHVDRIF